MGHRPRWTPFPVTDGVYMAGYEIADTNGLGADLMGQLVVLLAAGNNPMTAEAWESYVPPPGYTLNSPVSAGLTSYVF